MRGEALAHLLHVQAFDRLGVIAFDQKVQRSVDRSLGFTHRQTGLVGERGISGGVDEPVRFDSQSPEARREVYVTDTAVANGDIGQDGAHDGLYAGSLNLAFHPAPEPHFVVLKRHGRAVHAQQRTFRGHVCEQLVSYPVSDLVGRGAVSEKPDERTDDGADRLTSERWSAVDQDDLASKFGCFQCSADSGNARSEHA